MKISGNNDQLDVIDSKNVSDENFPQNNWLKKIFDIFSTLPNGVFAVSLFGLFLGMSTTMVYGQLTLFL